MLYIVEIKSLPCPNTVIQRYNNNYINGIPKWGTPYFKVSPHMLKQRKLLEKQKQCRNQWQSENQI